MWWIYKAAVAGELCITKEHLSREWRGFAFSIS